MTCYNCQSPIDESTDQYIVTDNNGVYCGNCFEQQTNIEYDYFVDGEYIGNTNNIAIYND